jgi:hypothetical protein
LELVGLKDGESIVVNEQGPQRGFRSFCGLCGTGSNSRTSRDGVPERSNIDVRPSRQWTNNRVAVSLTAMESTSSDNSHARFRGHCESLPAVFKPMTSMRFPLATMSP